MAKIHEIRDNDDYDVREIRGKETVKSMAKKTTMSVKIREIRGNDDYDVHEIRGKEDYDVRENP